MAEKKKKAEAPEAAPQEGYIVTGETRSGLKFQIDKRIKDDVRTMRYLTQMQNQRADIFTKSEALFSLLNLMFGTEDNLSVFMDEVAALHNGVADVPSLIDELTDIFESIKLKNS